MGRDAMSVVHDLGAVLYVPAGMAGLLILIMFVRASSGSPGGGLKLDRAAWLAKGFRTRARGGRVARDANFIPRAASERMVRRAAVLAGLWLLTWGSSAAPSPL